MKHDTIMTIAKIDVKKKKNKPQMGKKYNTKILQFEK